MCQTLYAGNSGVCAVGYVHVRVPMGDTIYGKYAAVQWSVYDDDLRAARLLQVVGLQQLDLGPDKGDPLKAEIAVFLGVRTALEHLGPRLVGDGAAVVRMAGHALLQHPPHRLESARAAD